MFKFNYLFLLIALIYLGIELFNLNELRFFIKPLLLIFLSLHFYSQTKNQRSAFSNFIQAGLFFSLLGDISLLFVSSNELFFIAGLILFLLAHIFYILAFRVDIKANLFQKSPIQLLVATVPFIAASLGVFIILKSSLGALLIPVIAYIFIITLMGIASALRYKMVTSQSFNLILFGAIFFMISDTLLAFNKFYAPFSFAGVFIMLTYILAQFLIVSGSIAQHSSNN